jgi:hypothetical protein
VRPRLSVLLLLGIAVAGCAVLPFGPGATLLDRADRLARDGSWQEAVRAYDEYLTTYPGSWAAGRALESRDTLAAILTARAELARLRQEVTRLREDLARRETDLVRVRQEADRLRIDLERLKEIDLRLERKK